MFSWAPALAVQWFVQAVERSVVEVLSFSMFDTDRFEATVWAVMCTEIMSSDPTHRRVCRFFHQVLLLSLFVALPALTLIRVYFSLLIPLLSFFMSHHDRVSYPS